MKRKISSVLGGVALALACSGSALAAPSSWANRAGMVDGNNATWWCWPTTIDGAGGRQQARAALRRIASNGDATEGSNAWINVRVGGQCFATAARTGASVNVISGWSTDAGNDVATSGLCPSDKPYLGFVRCQVDSVVPYYVYAGTPCGNGISSISNATVIGQLTGGVAELEGAPVPPLMNNTLAQAKVEGTDIGTMFYSGGAMQFAFGDTFSSWANKTDWRGSTIATTNDFNALDGITLTGWEGPQGFAQEIIASPHQGNGVGEITAIPNAGFAITEPNGDTYRYLWFFSVFNWETPQGLLTNHSTIAYSKNGATWDRAPFWFWDTRPVFAADSNFGAGAVYLDRLSGWIYLFGTKARMPGGNGPIRVAAVRATHATIMDRKQYYYWSGSSWVRDENGDMAESLTGAFGDGANIVPASVAPRAEISVTFNSYANRYQLLLQNTSAEGNGRFELWQSSTLLSGWSRVAGSETALAPNSRARYAPMMHELYLGEAGRTVPFLFSQFDPIYNVGLWKFTVNTPQRASCVNF